MIRPPRLPLAAREPGLAAVAGAAELPAAVRRDARPGQLRVRIARRRQAPGIALIERALAV
jgi:hypothetical protein